jgi:hypothetical protein
MPENFKFTIGGEEIFLNREEIEKRLAAIEPEGIREVSVEVGGRWFPVKQALSAAAGLLRGNFTTHQAMRVFRKLAFSLKAEPGGGSSANPGLAVFENTEELTCPKCNKPYTFKRLPSSQFALEGCSCKSPQPVIKIPANALLTDLGGLFVIRVPKEPVGVRNSI